MSTGGPPVFLHRERGRAKLQNARESENMRETCMSASAQSREIVKESTRMRCIPVYLFAYLYTYLHIASLRWYVFFFLSWLTKTQLNIWTKQVVRTQFIT